MGIVGVPVDDVGAGPKLVMMRFFMEGREMDPQAALDRFACALDDAKESAEALARWLSSGGFPPTWTKAGHEAFVDFCRAHGIALPGGAPGRIRDDSGKDPGAIPCG